MSLRTGRLQQARCTSLLAAAVALALLSGAAAQFSITVQNSCSVPVDFTVIFQVPSTSDYFATCQSYGQPDSNGLVECLRSATVPGGGSQDLGQTSAANCVLSTGAIAGIAVGAAAATIAAAGAGFFLWKKAAAKSGGGGYAAPKGMPVGGPDAEAGLAFGGPPPPPPAAPKGGLPSGSPALPPPAPPPLPASAAAPGQEAAALQGMPAEAKAMVGPPDGLFTPEEKALTMTAAYRMAIGGGAAAAAGAGAAVGATALARKSSEPTEPAAPTPESSAGQAGAPSRLVPDFMSHGEDVDSLLSPQAEDEVFSDELDASRLPNNDALAQDMLYSFIKSNTSLGSAVLQNKPIYSFPGSDLASGPGNDVHSDGAAGLVPISVAAAAAVATAGGEPAAAEAPAAPGSASAAGDTPGSRGTPAGGTPLSSGDAVALARTGASLGSQASQLSLVQTTAHFEDLEFVRPIGEGSFGRGSISDYERALAMDEAHLERLMAEAAVMANLRHPNIVTFMGLCTFPTCIVSEYCAKGSLTDVLRRAKRSPADMPWTRRLEMALGAARGMLVLHAASPPILHRDLKSPNLLIDENWTVKVSDFNLSKIMAAENKTSSLAAMNPRWLAPEIMSGEGASQASDMFSFGVVLWELMTWQLPWGTAKPWKIINLVLNGGRLELPPRDSLPGDDTPAFTGLDRYVALVKRCWAHNPFDRPTFSEVIPELRSLLEEAKSSTATAAVAARATAADQAGLRTAFGAGISEEAKVTSVP
ncbi:hypothetical protein ABPG75_008643 [Micractinium tetrahymenae]